MFEKIKYNVKPFDSQIRFLLATFLSIFAIHTQNYYYLIGALILYYTSYSKFCFIYYFSKINERFSAKNYYLSLLPKHNSSAVFIFTNTGEIVFENNIAKRDFLFIKSAHDLRIESCKDIITKDLSSTTIFKHQKRSYQIELVGLSKENILLAYFSDVTEIFELNDAIEETQREVIYAMGEIGETRSKETGNHVKRVANYSELLAKLYGLDEAEASLLKMASPMHDIGKVGIPDAILNAPRKLTDKEFEVMKTHASLGYNMLKNSNKPILQASAIVANEHHEKFDGTGYPNGKKSEDIHIYGRITAIADVFDALGSQRVYKEAWELERIVELFKEQSAKHFDPKLVKLFLDNLDSFVVIRDKFKDVK